MEKKISVIVTCHPAVERYLEECVHSIKAQTLPAHEIIIILDSYEKPMTYDGTTTLLRTQNLGVAKSRDQGVMLATGNYLLFVDADDALPEVFLEIMAEVNSDIVYPNILLWSYWSEKPKANRFYESPDKITEADMLKFNRVVVTSLMKRKVYDECGPFEEMPMFEDYKFFLKAIKRKMRFARADTYLKYRQRDNSRNHQSDELKRKIYKDIMNWYAKV